MEIRKGELSSIIDRISQDVLSAAKNISDIDETKLEIFVAHLIIHLQELCAFLYNHKKNSTTPQFDLNQSHTLDQSQLLISITELRVIYTALEVLWLWQYHSFYKKVFEINLQSDHPKSLLISYPQVLLFAEKCSNLSPAFTQVYPTFEYMEKLSTYPLLSRMMLERNLNRILIAYAYTLHFNSSLALANIYSSTLQSSISHSPAQPFTVTAIDICPSEVDRKLKELLIGPYSVLVVSNLTKLGKGPTWMKKLGSEWLATILVSEHGLESVLLAYLQGMTDTSEDLEPQSMVAKLVTATPAAMHKEYYLSQLCPQVLKLMSFAINNKNQRVLMRVCVLILTRIAFLSENTASQLLVLPLCKHLLLFGEKADISCGVVSNPTIIVSNEDFSSYDHSRDKCYGTLNDINEELCALYDILTLRPTTPVLLNILRQNGVFHSLLLLYTSIATTLFNEAENKIKISEISKRTDKNSSSASQSEITLNDVFILVQQCCYELFKVYSPETVTNTFYDLLVPKFAESQTERHAYSMITVNNVVGIYKYVNDNSRSQMRSSTLLKKSNDCSSAVLSVDATLKAIKSNQPKYNDDQIDVNSTSSIDDNVVGDDGDIDDFLKYAQALASVGGGIDNRGDILSNIIIDVTHQSEMLAKMCMSYISFVSDNTTATAEDANEKTTFISQFYLKCLKNYLLPGPEVESSTGTTERVKTAVGIILMVWQSKISAEHLLQQGTDILAMLELYLQSYLEYITDDYNTMNINSGSGSSSSSGGKSDRLYLRMISDSVTDSDYPTLIDDGTHSHVDNESLQSVFTILSSIVELGEKKRKQEDTVILRSIVQILLLISLKVVDQEIAFISKTLAKMILHKQTSVINDSPTVRTLTIDEHLLKIKTDYCGNTDDPALRAYGINCMNKYMQQSKDTILGITEKDISSVIEFYVNMLYDSESYVYLCALHALVDLSEIDTATVFETLLDLFDTGCSSRNTHSGAVTYRMRALIGESLLIICKQKQNGKYANKLRVKSIGKLIAACIKMAKHRPSADHSLLLDQHVDLKKLKVKPIGNQIASEYIGDDADENNIREDEATTKEAVKAADYVLLRQSSVSLLAEAIVTCGGEGVKFVDDVMDISLSILLIETDTFKNVKLSSQAKVNSRRAASFLLNFTTINLFPKLLEVDSIEVWNRLSNLKEKISLLKTYEKDKVVLFHITQSLVNMDELLWQQVDVNNSEQRWDILENPDIRVLN